MTAMAMTLTKELPSSHYCCKEKATAILQESIVKRQARDFPGGAVVKNPPASAGDTGSIPGPRRSHVLRSN